MRAILVAAALVAATAAFADEDRLNLDAMSGWTCKESYPGGPRVCGSDHSTYEPPRIINRYVPIDRPVPVPVPVETPVYIPSPLPAPVPHYHGTVTYGRPGPRIGSRIAPRLPRHWSRE